MIHTPGAVRRRIHGLDYEVTSPSNYRLLSVRCDVADDAIVSVRFTGFKWCICYESPQAGAILRPFPSFAAAVGLLASRAQLATG